MTIPRRKPRFYKGQRREALGFILGLRRGRPEDVALFEEKFASYIGRKFAVATCSGRNAMEVIFDAMGIKKGDEVIVPAYTLKDLVILMKEKGIDPVLADVDADSFNIDPSKIEDKITSATRAIIATHIFGVPCEIDRIKEIASRRGIRVIEDCAHSAGARYEGRRTGAFGDASFFSFETIKPLNTFGGGVIVTDDEGVASRARSATEKYPSNDNAVRKKMLTAVLEDAFVRGPVFTFLMRMFVSRESVFTRFYWSFRAGTRVRYSRYSPIQAGMALKQLDALEALDGGRARAAAKLAKALAGLAVPQRVPSGAERAHYFYVVRLNTSKPAEVVRREMLYKGVDCGVREEITDNCALVSGDRDGYPVTAGLYSANLQLPMYDGMTDESVELVVQALRAAAIGEGK